MRHICDPCVNIFCGMGSKSIKIPINQEKQRSLRTIFLTGATGVMGGEGLRRIAEVPGRYKIRLLVRPSKTNHKKLAPYLDREDVTVVWGDLLNADDVKRAMGDSDTVLHVGGMVSPKADHYPERTMHVNVTAARNVVDAVKARKDADEVRVVYIGSVAQISCHDEPYHWGRSGDPLVASEFDYYAVSKILAERVFAESGLKHWVSLRQSGILHPGLLFKGNDPITFHVPLRGVLEWATMEDSGRLLEALCNDDIPEEFWRNFYNISSGADYRLSNYRFEQLLLKAIGCPSPEKVFDTNWFATRNFHGCWYTDADRLEEMVPFRENMPVEKYFDKLAAGMPAYFKLAKIVPAALIKMVMKRVALTEGLGTLSWLRSDRYEDKVRAFFGGREAQAEIPDWEHFPLEEPSHEPLLLNHGYDELKPDEALDINDMRSVAEYRGGKCLSESMTPGDLDTPLEWECAFGHRFRLTPRSVLKGGHWCEQCQPAYMEKDGIPGRGAWHYDEESRRNPFLAQIWKQVD